jgi:hypothetical protein
VAYKVVAIWPFLFYSDMSSTDGRLQKSPDSSPEKKHNSPPDDFREKKKRAVEPYC